MRKDYSKSFFPNREAHGFFDQCEDLDDQISWCRCVFLVNIKSCRGVEYRAEVHCLIDESVTNLLLGLTFSTFTILVIQDLHPTELFDSFIFYVSPSEIVRSLHLERVFSQTFIDVGFFSKSD